ncbi:MAG: signal recognition particle-docking protein FtsY [Bacteroidota bacterium]
MGFWDFFRRTPKEDVMPSQKKNRTPSFWSRLKKIFIGSPQLSTEILENLEELLIEADVGTQVTEDIVDFLQEKIDVNYSFDQIVDLLKQEITIRLRSVHPTEPLSLQNPHIILVVGVNGVGKTTTIGKLAHYYVRKKKRVILGAADTFRAAAPEQLAAWAERSSSMIVNRGMQKDPSSVAYATVQRAQEEGADIVIIDTAGRLQNKIPLMNQLSKIKRVTQKLMPTAPHEVLLVLDATTGQNGWRQATVFKEMVGVTGLIVTKLDSGAKGGIIIGIATELGIPVKYLGFGEKLEDLKVFNVDQFVERFFEDKT